MGTILSLQKSKTISNLNNNQKINNLKQQNSKSSIPYGQLVKLQNNTHGLYIHCDIYDIDVNNKLSNINIWLKHKQKYSCNVIDYDISLSFLSCNTIPQIKIIFQYGDSSLSSLLGKKQLQQTQIYQQMLNVSASSSIVRMIKIIKFMINVIQQQLHHNKKWISFHTNTIISFNNQSFFKLLYLPKYLNKKNYQTFFDPQLINDGCNQKSTIYSIGIVLLSIFINEDCSQCFNYNNYTICKSLLEQKYEKAQDILKSLQNFNSTKQQHMFCLQQDLYQLICLSTQSYSQRISFQQFKGKFYKILNKINKNLLQQNLSISQLAIQNLSFHTPKIKLCKKQMNSKIQTKNQNKKQHISLSKKQFNSSNKQNISSIYNK